MSRAKKKYIPKPFESTGGKDTSANVFMSMLTHPAFTSMKPSAKTLYLYCKAQLYGEKGKEVVNGKDCFTMNKFKWQSQYKLYGNSNGFYRDMDTLIDHGFIDCVVCGAISRRKSLYCYSDRWLLWGTNDFEVPERVKTRSYKNKEKT